MIVSIKEYIEEKILPCYSTFDKAHQRDHAEKVIRESLELARYYPVNMDMVYIIAAYHDLGLSKGRDQHHIESGKMLLADEFLKARFTEE